jgi:hypothetical protein
VEARSSVSSLSHQAEVAWPDSYDGRYARAYLTPFSSRRRIALIANVYNTELHVAQVADPLVLPLTLSDFHPAKQLRLLTLQPLCFLRRFRRGSSGWATRRQNS